MGSVNVIADSVYLDTNVLIYAVENVAGWGDRMRQVFDRIDCGDLKAVASELALAEVLVKPIRDGAAAVRREYEALLGSNSPIFLRPITREVLSRAAELRARHGEVKLPDAIHAATALLAGCGAFLTNDIRLERVLELPVFLLSKLP